MFKFNISRVIFYLFIIVGLFVIIDIIVAVKKFEYPGTQSQEILVEIPSGASLKRISNILEQSGAINDQRAFTIVVRLLRSSGDIQAGEYLIPAKSSMGDIFKEMRAGNVYEHSITFAEGLTVEQIKALINNDKNLSGEITIEPNEGDLLPETYHFHKGEKRTDLLQRMQNDMHKTLDQLWSERPEDFPLTSKQQALTLASIVEKETSIPDERGQIAAVFLNRLKANMRLQSDPTVIYGITKGLPLGRALLEGDLNADTPFNTYKNKGLPPTPIANPGRASLEAVFYAPPSGHYYFVADGTGGHVFSGTLDEHNKNVREWRRIKKQKQ